MKDASRELILRIRKAVEFHMDALLHIWMLVVIALGEKGRLQGFPRRVEGPNAYMAPLSRGSDADTDANADAIREGWLLIEMLRVTHISVSDCRWGRLYHYL